MQSGAWPTCQAEQRLIEAEQLCLNQQTETERWNFCSHPTTLRHKRSHMLMDWKNQHLKNGHPTKSNLQIQCNPHQNSNSILHSWKELFENSSGISKSILNNKKTSEGITMSAFKLFYKASVLKTAWCWYRDRKVDQ